MPTGAGQNCSCNSYALWLADAAPALGATHLSVHAHNRAHSVRMRLEAHKAVRALQVQRRGPGDWLGACRGGGAVHALAPLSDVYSSLPGRLN